MVLQTPPESPVYRFPEACRYLKIGETKLRQLVASRKLPVVRLGRGIRFTRWSLDEYLRSAESADID